MPKSKTDTKAFDFETSLAELSTLVEVMEQGGITLEDSLKNLNVELF